MDDMTMEQAELATPTDIKTLHTAIAAVVSRGTGHSHSNPVRDGKLPPELEALFPGPSEQSPDIYGYHLYTTGHTADNCGRWEEDETRACSVAMLQQRRQGGLVDVRFLLYPTEKVGVNALSRYMTWPVNRGMDPPSEFIGTRQRDPAAPLGWRATGPRSLVLGVEAIKLADLLRW